MPSWRINVPVSKYSRAPVTLPFLIVRTSQNLRSSFFRVGAMLAAGVLSVPSCVPRPKNSVTTAFSEAIWFWMSTRASENAVIQPLANSLNPDGPLNVSPVETLVQVQSLATVFAASSSFRWLNSAYMFLASVRFSFGVMGSSVAVERWSGAGGSMPLPGTRARQFSFTSRPSRPSVTHEAKRSATQRPEPLSEPVGAGSRHDPGAGAHHTRGILG